jgi:hypothetical protein
MWLMILAMLGVMVLVMMGVMILVMVVLHRKPHQASASAARETHRN